MAFTVKQHAFEGPLDLLLELIEKRKLFVSDIALAEVTDAFIDHVRSFETMPMGESAHFILVASTLLLIKSKSLLPELALSEEEQGDIRDLETRLKIYKRLKDASRGVAELFGADVVFARSPSRAIDPVFAPDPGFSLERSLLSLKDLIRRLPKKEALPAVAVRKILSIEEMIGDLTKRITSELRMKFSRFTEGHKGERVNVIVSFLAMLELVKQGVLQVSQEREFADIDMETKQVGVPTY